VPSDAPTPTVTPTATPRATSTPTPASPSPTEVDSPQASATEAAGEEVQVLMDLSSFDPEELTIAVGTKVTFVNVAPFEHTVTEGTGGRAVEDPIIDVEVAVDGSTDYAFDEPGVYDITCRIHPSMQLTITVEG
jgi:plastocyanin